MSIINRGFCFSNNLVTIVGQLVRTHPPPPQQKESRHITDVNVINIRIIPIIPTSNILNFKSFPVPLNYSNPYLLNFQEFSNPYLFQPSPDYSVLAAIYFIVFMEFPS